MRFIVFSFILIILLSSFAVSRNGLGISPPKIEFIYTGQEIIEGEFKILPMGEKNLKIDAIMDLASYVYFENHSTELRVHLTGDTTFKFYMELPGDIKPGDYKTLIAAEQFFKPGEGRESGFSSAIPAIGMVIVTRVPNQGKFLEANLVVPGRIKVGDTASFAIEMLNLGTEDLTNLETEIVIRDPREDVIARKKTTKIGLLKPAQKGTITATWKTDGQSSGFYSAEAAIDYKGKFPLKLKKDFRIGDVYIEIVNVSTNLEESVAIINIDIASHWNDAINDVYAELIIKKDDQIIDEIKTSSVNLGPWGKDRLIAFWERKSLAPGDYDIEIYVYYFDKQSNRHLLVQLPELLEKKAPTPLESPLIIITIVLLGIIVLINAAWFLASLIRKPRKK